MRHRFRVALGIRAQLLLVLTVFLVIPFLGYEYVRELERVLRDAQERTLAGTAQAVATALHDRARLFDIRPVPLPSLAAERKSDDDPSPRPSTRRAQASGSASGRGGGDRADPAGPVADARADLCDRSRLERARARGLAQAFGAGARRRIVPR